MSTFFYFVLLASPAAVLITHFPLHSVHLFSHALEKNSLLFLLDSSFSYLEILLFSFPSSEDYEWALVKALRKQFGRKMSIQGCYFYFKQAQKKKLASLNLDKNCIAKVNLTLSFLTVLPKKHVGLGVSWMEQRFPEQSLLPFWLYFRKESITTHPPKMWQLLDPARRSHTIRTTNGLESLVQFVFNKVFSGNKLFSSVHLCLLQEF